MPIRLKKLIGTFLLVALVIVYALVASIVAVAQLSESGPLVHFLFFLFSGLLWVLPAMGIIKWLILEPTAEGLKAAQIGRPPSCRALASGVVTPDSMVRIWATLW